MRLNPEIIKAIDTLANEQNRNRSNTIEYVLFEWFREHRKELVEPAIKEAARLSVSDNEVELDEAYNLLAGMPGEEVADAIDAIRDEPTKGRPKKAAAPDPARKARKAKPKA